MSEMRGGSERPRIKTTWPPKGRARRSVLGLAAVTAAAGAIMVFSAAGASADQPTGTGAEKYYVCKYVDKPGQNEVLQTGQNPIVVDANAIGEDPVVIGSFFNDEHGRSYVLAAFPQSPEPTRDQCPGAVTTTEPVPPSSPAPSNPESNPPSSNPVTNPPTTPSHAVSASSAHRTTAVAATSSSAPIPAGVSAGLHTPIANAGLKAWGTVLMLLGGAAGLLAGLWPTRRRVH